MTSQRTGYLALLLVLFNVQAFAAGPYDFVVAKDGSDNFQTIQEAFSACRDYADRQYVIFVKNGICEEKLVIPTWKAHITIIGQNVDSTIVMCIDYAKSFVTLRVFDLLARGGCHTREWRAPVWIVSGDV